MLKFGLGDFALEQGFGICQDVHDAPQSALPEFLATRVYQA